MSWPDVNLKHLRVFVEVCRVGGITAATEFVNLSQPAITQAISGLERKLSSRLFSRRGRSLFPTESGKILHDRGSRALSFLENLAERKKLGFRHHRLRQLTNRQIRSLIAVAQTHSYSEAARSIAVSQPSLYRSAKELENLCAVPLFRKSARGIDLTVEGKALFQAAKLTYAEIEQGIEEIQISEGRQGGTLRIGSLPLARGTILPTALNEFLLQYPRTRISIIDSPFEELLEALRYGDIDIMIGALRTPTPAPDVVQEQLMSDQLGIYCGPAHPALQISAPSKEQLATFPWVVARGDTPTRQYFERFFEGHHPSTECSFIETNSMATVRHLLSDNQKLALLSVTQAKEHVALNQIRSLQVDIADTPRAIGLTIRQNWNPTAQQAALIRQLRQASIEIADSNYA